jgi:hypothetical protein
MEEHALASSAFALKLNTNKLIRLKPLLVLLCFSFLTRFSLSEVIFEESFQGKFSLST